MGGKPGSPTPPAHPDVARRGVDARDLKLVEVILLGATVLEGDLAESRETHAHENGAFELRADSLRIDLRAAVEGDVDARNAQLALVADRNFHHSGRVADEAVVSGQTQPAALGKLASPTRLARRDFDHAAQTPRIHRVA